MSDIEPSDSSIITSEPPPPPRSQQQHKILVAGQCFPSQVSSTKNLSNPQHIRKAPVIPDLAAQIRGNALLPMSSNFARLQAFQPQGLQQPTAIASESIPAVDTSGHNQIQSLESLEETRRALVAELERCRELGFIGPLSGGKNSSEPGQPSSPKRFKRESTWQENHQPSMTLPSLMDRAFGSEEYQRIPNNSSHTTPRPIKNSLYDPMYEAMGLPIDPHLRMFALQNSSHSATAKTRGEVKKSLPSLLEILTDGRLRQK